VTPLRATIEQDLALTLEGDFASTDAAGAGLVTLVDPDGTVYAGLKAQVLYDYRRIEPTTGETVVVHEPVVTLRRSSLTRIPLDGERWELRMPVSPLVGAAIVSFLLGAGRAPEGGQTLGFVRLYPKAVRMTPAEVLPASIASTATVGAPVVAGV
jgi:hypothetical protein